MSDVSFTKITKDTFWELMAWAKERSGQDICAEYDWLEETLKFMAPEQVLRFQHFMRSYRDMAYKYGLWSAACILTHGCSDDGFIDFRTWLIAQGRETYLAALKDPDSLVMVEPYGGCRFENLSYLGDMIYEEKTGRSVYDEAIPRSLQMELDMAKREIVYNVNIDYPLEWHELEAYLPRLSAKYLTTEQIRANIMRGATMWNPHSLEVQTMRKKHGPKKGRIPHKRKGDAR